jgi:hypothetical protein
MMFVVIPMVDVRFQFLQQYYLEHDQLHLENFLHATISSNDLQSQLIHHDERLVLSHYVLFDRFLRHKFFSNKKKS